MIKHMCDERTLYHTLMLEFPEPDAMQVYPEDAIVFYKNFQWWIKSNEYHVPIAHCPYCGKELG